MHEMLSKRNFWMEEYLKSVQDTHVTMQGKSILIVHEILI